MRWEVHKDLARFHADGIGRYTQLVVECARAGGSVERPGVPGTAQQRTFERALPERATVVWTNAMQGPNLAGDVADGVELMIHFDFENFAGG
jgi:hypothetical protein